MPSGFDMKKSLWVGGGLLLAIAFAAFYAIRWSSGAPATDIARGRPAESFVLAPTGPLTVAAGGDTLIGRPIAPSGNDAAFDAIVAVVRNATLAITNLEMNLLGDDNAKSARGSRGPRWTFGSAREAADLASLGFDLVSQANNHATDYGTEGMADTSAILTASDLIPAGSGRDLGEARAPVFIGSGPRKIAVLAVAISSSPTAMATPTRGTSKGWPGINAIRYVADVTVDAQTYETLRRSTVLPGGSETGSNRLTISGATIKKGTRTAVNLVPDARDIEEILTEVGRARALAEVVVLSLHNHEPSNDSDEPAEFVRRFAQQAIDAGASLVVGHGPHRLRGVEVYKGGAILYSLGNFLYQPEEGQSPSADSYDGGIDMFSLAMGIPGPARAGHGVDSEEWWEGAVAVATFDAGVLRLLHVHPIDLGVDLPAARKGIPRVPALPRTARILERLRRLSERYDTTIRLENGVGIVALTPLQRVIDNPRPAP
jgi:poly-gamma-glutamate capsule biosynthesis protein CapA/YwtB (metallophosphatase superfamily)